MKDRLVQLLYEAEGQVNNDIPTVEQIADYLIEHGVIVTNKNKNNKKEKDKMNNQKVIVRADKAGVFYGEIKERNGNEVVMTNVRRLWYWDGAASLSQLAVNGTVRPNNCKFTVVVPEMTILGIIEIIPCTEKAIESIEGVSAWKI